MRGRPDGGEARERYPLVPGQLRQLVEEGVLRGSAPAQSHWEGAVDRADGMGPWGRQGVGRVLVTRRTGLAFA